MYKYKKFKIGEIEIENPIFLAPMAGVTDHPFRLICKHFGAGVVYTEFVSANGIIRENIKTLDMMKFTEEERPMGIQIMGNFGEDKKVLEFGLAYDQITDFLNQRPQMREV